MSTFNFDPDYFERKLLGTLALRKARRIAVFMDAGQWQHMRSQDVPARWLNRRYLVVPVQPSTGVFHPKLHLILSDQSSHVLCGSNNLTRAGCSHNLELLNSVYLAQREQVQGATLLRSTFCFFEMVAEQALGDASKVVKAWIRDEKRSRGWLGDHRTPSASGEEISLVHTLNGTLWRRLIELTQRSAPKRMVVISPYYDADAEMFKRVRRTWPQCRLQVVAQQHTSNLPVATIKSARLTIDLCEVSCQPRRLHAKLLAWESTTGGGCFVGSANFTAAAWDGHNVEACLFIPGPEMLVDRLFDSQLPARRIKVRDFVPGMDREPESSFPEAEWPMPILRSASLTSTCRLHVQYHCPKELGATDLAVSVRAGGEQRPRAVITIPIAEESQRTLQLKSQLVTDVHGTIVVSLIAKLPHGEQESSPVWLIQEEHLTYEPSEGDSARSHSAVVANGFGIPEFLEELGRREGIQGIIAYLNHLNIHFNDGSRGHASQRRFRVRRSDPFHPDALPEWWRTSGYPHADLQKAIYQFVRRHEDMRLKKHATRGNINGVENFLDIFVALIRLLYIYRVRGVVEKYQLIRHIRRCLEIATMGIETDYESSKGYLLRLSQNLSGNKRLLQDVAKEFNFPGYLNAALLIAEKAAANQPRQSNAPEPVQPYQIRRSHTPDMYVMRIQNKGHWVTTHKHTSGQLSSASGRLPELRKTLCRGLAVAGLKTPTTEEIMAAFESFEMFSESELADYRATLLQPLRETPTR